MEARVERFLERAAAIGATGLEVREMDDSTHTAADAAAAVGAPVAAIVKSLLLLVDAEPVMALVSGVNRVDAEVLGSQLEAPVTLADAKTVKRVTGSSIGGVPPFGHLAPLPTLLDESLLALDVLWAAAGSARAVFPIPPARLVELTSARIVRVG